MTDATNDTPEPSIDTTWNPDDWNWASNQRPPVDYIAGEDRIPTEPSTDYGDASGHWNWLYSYGNYDVRTEEDPTLTLVARWPSWFFDDVPAPPTPLERALVAQQDAASQIDGLIAAIRADREANRLGNVPILGTIVGVWNSLRQVDSRVAALTEVVGSQSAVTRNLIAELLAAQQINTMATVPEPTTE